MRTKNWFLLGPGALAVALVAVVVMMMSPRTVVGWQQDGTPAASPMARGGGTGAVYMTVTNEGDEAELLLSGETDVAEIVEIHETVADGEVMQMRPLSDGLEIAASEDVTLEPGGFHVMLIGLTEDLTNGMTFDLDLEFAEAGEVTLPVNVRPRAATDDDEVTEPVTVGDLTITDVWSRPAPAIGAGTAMGTPAASPAAGGATSVLVAENPDLGAYLTDNQGMTLYIFTNDEENESTCYDQCAENWPPFTVEGEIVVPDGVAGEFDTITRDDGTEQVTHDGRPLYSYVQDSEPGDTTGEGVGDVWFVAPAAGASS